MTGLIESRGLRMEFGGLVAVDDVDMRIDSGEIRGLIGPNGSGKTTLLNLMSGWLRPRSGRLLWKGEEVTRQSHYQLARLGIGRTFQLGTLFEEMTCLQNVSMSLYASTPWNPIAGILGLRSEGSRARHDRAAGPHAVGAHGYSRHSGRTRRISPSRIPALARDCDGPEH